MIKCSIVGVQPGVEFTELQLASADASVTTDVNPAFKGCAVFKIACSNDYLKSQSGGISDWSTLVGSDIMCNVRYKLKENKHRYYYITQINVVK